MPLSHGHQLKVEQEGHDEHVEIDEHVEYVGERVSCKSRGVDKVRTFLTSLKTNLMTINVAFASRS